MQIGENQAETVNTEVINREVHKKEENTSSEGVRTRLGNQVTVEERKTETDGTKDSSEVEESTIRAGVWMQENVYQSSTNFDFATNPAYVIDVAIVPEIPTEDNVAYEHMCSSQV